MSSLRRAQRQAKGQLRNCPAFSWRRSSLHLWRQRVKSLPRNLRLLVWGPVSEDCGDSILAGCATGAVTARAAKTLIARMRKCMFGNFSAAKDDELEAGVLYSLTMVVV